MSFNKKQDQLGNLKKMKIDADSESMSRAKPS